MNDPVSISMVADLTQQVGLHGLYDTLLVGSGIMTIKLVTKDRKITIPEDNFLGQVLTGLSNGINSDHIEIVVRCGVNTIPVRIYTDHIIISHCESWQEGLIIIQDLEKYGLTCSNIRDRMVIYKYSISNPEGIIERFRNHPDFKVDSKPNP